MMQINDAAISLDGWRRCPNLARILRDRPDVIELGHSSTNAAAA